MNDTNDGGRKLRAKERKTYVDHDLDDDDIEGKRSYNVEEKLVSDKFNKEYVVQDLKGEDFNLKYFQENGLTRPILFKEKSGLGLRVPSDNFKVNDVKACVGSRRLLDVMDVNTQKGIEMTMKEWVKYYENLERDRLLNVISLEFSHTKLENYVESPNIVREIDWVDTAWPQHLKDCQTEATNAIDKMKYPKVQKYCLMSVQGCYTDFHIDFGGTSVWYHILHGEKIFWLIPPTSNNVSQYENWVLSGKQGDIFLGDAIGDCQRVRLVAGNTFIIPSGWIHAVYTPKDSLVFGGNFLHNFNMVNQLRVAGVEDRTRVKGKFRYPFYAEINWYVLERYVHSLTGVTYLEKPELNEDLEMTEKDSSLESLEDKLNKRVSVALTRIDDSPRRKSTSDDDSTASGPTRSPGQALPQPRTGRKSSTESVNSNDGTKLEKTDKQLKVPYRSPVKKKTKYVHLTKWELEGLREIVGWVESLPVTKKGIPKDLIDPEAVLMEVKRIIQEHINDNPELAITGEPVLEWTKATKKLIKLKQKAKTAKLMGAMSSTKVKGAGKNASGGSRHRRVRCKKCEPCTRDDCMECNFCKDMKKYGGPGRAKQSCISRQCLAPMLPNNVSCLICNLDKPLSDRHSDADTEEARSLMECGLCWEIVHPVCLNKKYENLNNEGVINEDLPNSWKCSKCCFDGKEGQLKTRVFKGGWRPNPTGTPPPLIDIDGNQSPKSPGLSVFTDGKRVTVNQAADVKPPIITKTAASPRNTPSPPVAVVKMEEDAKTPVIKTESPANQTRSVSGKKSSTGKILAKRKLPQVASEPSKRVRLAKQTKSLKTSKGSASKSPKPAADLTRRSKREETAEVTTLYDFDDTEMTDATSHVTDKGKSKANSKGKKLTHVRDLESSFQTNELQEPRPMETMMQPRRFMTNEQIRQSLYEHIQRKNPTLVNPKFVVRPAPCPPPDSFCPLDNGHNHCLPRPLWLKIFHCLSPGELSRCLAVCKVWNSWCISPELWTNIDLSRRRILQTHLLGVVRRQPASLNITSVIMTQKQIIWLLERLPLLKSLILSKCSWVTISGLCLSVCPLLYTLDVSWSSGINDSCFEDMITPPVDRKPALKHISRLHRLKNLNLSGTEISDDSLRLITVYLSRLENLNLSYCTRITDEGIQSLASFRSATQQTIQVLNVSGCRQLTDLSLQALKSFSNLQELDVSNCIKMTPERCNGFHLNTLAKYKW